jgi:prophage DNA circulation protein
MSGFTNITGFAAPASVAGFLGLLQTASFRGVPFKVISSQIKKGRKIASHDYPFRDGGWAEDMGRALRTYSFTGYLIGDLGAAMQLALDTVVELPGPGLLIHPTVGAQMVAVLSCSTSVRKDAMRVIEVAFEFIEQGDRSLTATLIATAVSVISATSDCLTAAGTDLGSSAGPSAAAGSAPIAAGVSVVASFGAACALGGADPAGIVSVAAGLAPADSTVTYGRYAAGSASTALPAGTTVATLQADITAQRAAIAAAASAATTAAAGFSATTAPALVTTVAAVVEAMRATMSDPADQVRVLLHIAGFPFTAVGSVTGIAGDVATVTSAMSAMCRRMALVSVARATSVYQPVSYQDAQTLLTLVTTAFDVEITAAADAGEDATYGALRTLRVAVVTDLTTRGATLPQVITAAFALPLPALVVAQILYRDATRSDEIAAEADMPHPAFCPISMQVLAA